MKKVLLFVTGLALAAVSTAALAEAETFTGTLIDNACFKADMSPEDLAKHTRDCALMDGCVTSGYVVVTADGHVYKLDVEGNEKAVTALKKSEQAANLKVTVKGVNENGIIKVESITFDT